MKYVSTLLLALCASTASAQSITGIPPVVFDPLTLATATSVVNNTAANATDTNNPWGTASKPRRTIPTTLPAGAVVEVSGGPYAFKSVTWTAQGTAEAPVVVRGVGRPVIAGAYGSKLVLTGSGLVVSGFTFDNVSVSTTAATSGVVFERNEVRNHESYGSSAAVSVLGRYVTVRDNDIHHNGDANRATELDIHGVYVAPGAAGVWILRNTIHHNGGDAIQVGSASSPEPWASHVFIGANRLYQDRENGLDIKRSRDVVAAQNLIYGYVVRSSSSGEAIVTHDGAQRVWIVNNVVAASNRGVVSTGARDYVVLGNLIVGIHHSPYEAYDPANLFASAGVITYDTVNSYHLFNTLADVDAGFSLPKGITRTQVVNNIVDGGVHGIAFGSTTALTDSVVSHNLLTGASVFVSGLEYVMPPVDPGFVPGGYQIGAASVALDAGLSTELPAAFAARYGVALDKDVYGATRLQGRAYDIGASEYAPE
jgi:hypothetical protein